MVKRRWVCDLQDTERERRAKWGGWNSGLKGGSWMGLGHSWGAGGMEVLKVGGCTEGDPPTL